VDGRANYDALLTLTNLASVNDSVRKHILKERALPKIEEFWFETGQEDLRAAAAELLLNLLFCEEYFKEVLKVGRWNLMVIMDSLIIWFFIAWHGQGKSVASLL
jgi:hypothetical protein